MVTIDSEDRVSGRRYTIGQYWNMGIWAPDEAIRQAMTGMRAWPFAREVRPFCAAGALLQEGLIIPPFASSEACEAPVLPRQKNCVVPNRAPKRR